MVSEGSALRPCAHEDKRQECDSMKASNRTRSAGAVLALALALAGCATQADGSWRVVN